MNDLISQLPLDVIIAIISLMIVCIAGLSGVLRYAYKKLSAYGDSRVERVEAMLQNIAGEQQRIQKEIRDDLHALRMETAGGFVRKEDFTREIATVHGRLNALSGRIDKARQCVTKSEAE